MNSRHNPADRIIAETVFGIIKRRAIAESGKPICFRVKALTAEVVHTFLVFWKAYSGDSGLGAANVVVNGYGGTGFASKFQVDPRRSLADYLDGNRNGLIYLETGMEDGGHDFESLCTLRDVDFLNGRFDADGDVVDDIIRLTSRAVGYEPHEIPQRISRPIGLILRLIHPDSVFISIRTFVEFCYGILSGMLSGPLNPSPQDLNALIGDGLSVLGLFPDEGWRIEDSKEIIKERLTSNAYFSRLRDLAGMDMNPEILIAKGGETVFSDLYGRTLPHVEQVHWRILTEQYILDRSPAIQQQLPYYIFTQLFTPTLPEDVSEPAQDKMDVTAEADQLSEVEDGPSSRGHEVESLPHEGQHSDLETPSAAMVEADKTSSPTFEPKSPSSSFSTDRDVRKPEPTFESNTSMAVTDDDKSKPGKAVDEPDITINAEAVTAPEGRKLSDEELTGRYQLILDTFEEFDISVQAARQSEDRFVEGPASVLYRIRPGTGVDPKRIREKADALKIALELESDQNIRFSIDRGFITIDVPKNEGDRYFVTAAYLWSQWSRFDEDLSVPLGLDSLGSVVAINFSSSNSPHLLIAGTTGSGKSEALNTILGGFTNHYDPDQLRLLLVDPKGTELGQFEESPFLEGEIGWDETDAIGLLQHAVTEMQTRYRIFREAKRRSLQEYNRAADPKRKLPWWLIVLDEFADLTSNADDKKNIEGLLKRLAQKARAAGIHVIIATQKPSADVISTNLRSNLPAQLALRVKSSTESRVIMDENGAEALNGKGDAFLKSEGRVTRIQCAKM